MLKHVKPSGYISVKEDKLLNLLGLIVKFVWESLLTYAASEVGAEELVVILNMAEADGIDIPFYEPSTNGVNSTMGGSGSFDGQPSEQSQDYVAPVSTRKVTPKEG